MVPDEGQLAEPGGLEETLLRVNIFPGIGVTVTDCMSPPRAQEWVEAYGGSCPCCEGHGLHLTQSGNDPNAMEYGCESCDGISKFEGENNAK